jgi:hypothetical protein
MYENVILPPGSILDAIEFSPIARIQVSGN